MRLRQANVLLALVVVFAMIVAACGGDGGTETTDTQAAGETTTTAAGEPTTTEGSEPSGDRVPVRWFVGLGTGGNPEQIEAQEAVVEAFNSSQDEIELILEIVQNDVAYDTLSTQIASGNAPDIIGPVGIRGANAYNGRWLDLQPLVDSTGYDLSQWEEEQVDVWRTDEGLVGLPFGVFPSVIFYNKPLFDEAGLAYPPQEFGEDYADGRPWDMDTFRDIAMFLTVDENGNDATSADFDPDGIVQYGWVEQWSEPQRLATWFGAGSMTNDDGTPNIPDNWVEGFKWYYDSIWTDYSHPTADAVGSDLLAAGNPFDSGNVAMAHTHLWYTCCLEGVSDDWDMAVVPTYDGVATSGLHADVFRILNTTEVPDEAFEVLTYLVGEAAPDLLQAYGGMPAKAALQDAFFASQDEVYPQGVNWEVAVESLAFPDIPSHEQDMPNFLKAQDRWGAFFSLLNSTPGLDVEAEVEKLKADLETIYAETS